MPPPPPSCASARWRWFYGPLTLFMLPPPPSQARARQRWVLCFFDPIRAAATSLACDSEMEVGFMSFQPLLHCHHLPCMQEQDGGGFYGLSTPFTPPPLPSHTTVSQMWVFMALWPHSHRRYPSHATVGQRWFVWLLTLFVLLPPPLHATVSRSLSGSW